MFSQRKQPDSALYLLRIDKQTKGSYKSHEVAQSAALEIKIAYPIVQVSIYDSVDNSARLVTRRRLVSTRAPAREERTGPWGPTLRTTFINFQCRI